MRCSVATAYWYSATRLAWINFWSDVEAIIEVASRGLYQLPILLNAESPIYLMDVWAFLLMNFYVTADIKTMAAFYQPWRKTIPCCPECAAVNGHGPISVFEWVMQPFLIVFCFEPWPCVFYLRKGTTEWLWNAFPNETGLSVSNSYSRHFHGLNDQTLCVIHKTWHRNRQVLFLSRVTEVLNAR